MIGQLIDNRYQIEKLLGRGGMGAVYRATDQLENQTVALKVLHFFLGSDSEAALTRFYREFRVLARLDHPRIVRAYHHGTHEGVPYLVMEYLAGRPLSDQIVAGPLPRNHLLALARQICEALIYLHSRSIVHRDLKPGNLMLVENGDDPQVKLMDFGLVRATDLSRQLTQEGVALGTVAYMSPEQAQALPVDFRSDLYALGVILYEMATGRTPFTHQNPAVILMQQLTQSPPSPRQFNPNLDEPLEALILHLLAKEPAERPAGPEWVATHLAHLADESAPLVVAASKRVDVIPHVPLIGRESLLNELLQAWGQTVAGQGQVVWLAGTVGVGKSRLLAEVGLQARLSREAFLTGHCREHASLPYQPLIEILENLARHLTPAQREALPHELAPMLPGPASISTSGQLSRPDQADSRWHLFSAYWEFWQQAAQSQPRLIVIDNIHWADPTTLEVLGYLAQRVEQAQIMLVLTYQPEEVDPGTPLTALQRDLQGEIGVHVLALEPLNRAQVADFLRIAVGQIHLPDWLVESFYQATGGNPLFIEETLKALAAEGQINKDLIEPLSRHTTSTLPGKVLQLPQNVLALAERRLQLLSAEDRSALTAAAILGPEFSFALLAQVTQLDEDTLLDTIDRLLVARLIIELSLQGGEDRYRFTQEALRQALLNTVSQRRLRSLHRRAGEAIELLYGNNQPRHWPALAFHWSQAEVPLKATTYLQKVGDAAARVYANIEAIVCYRQALSLLKQEPGEAAEAERLLMPLFIRLGRALELESRFDEALTTYVEMETAARQRNDQPLLLAALMRQQLLHSTANPLFNAVKGQALAEQGLQLAQELNDQAAEARIYWILVNLHNFLNDLTQSIEYGERSLALARELGLKEQIAFTLNDVSRAYWFSGQLDRTWETYQEASQLWRELDNRPMLADSLSSLVGPAIFLGFFDKAIALAEEALQISDTIGNVWGQSYSRLLVGQVHWERGEPERAITTMQESIRLGQQVSSIVPQVITRADLAATYAGLGLIDLGLETAQQALAVAEQEIVHLATYPLAVLIHLHRLKGNLAGAEAAMAKIQINRARVVPIYQTLAYFAEAELALGRADYDRALFLADITLAQLRRLKMIFYIPRLLDLRAQILLALGQREAAVASWQEARNQLETLNARTRLWPILLNLSRLETDPAEVARLHQQAVEIIRTVADHISSPELQDSFLNLPEVRAALVA